MQRAAVVGLIGAGVAGIAAAIGVWVVYSQFTFNHEKEVVRATYAALAVLSFPGLPFGIVGLVGGVVTGSRTRDWKKWVGSAAASAILGLGAGVASCGLALLWLLTGAH